MEWKKPFLWVVTMMLVCAAYALYYEVDYWTALWAGLYVAAVSALVMWLVPYAWEDTDENTYHWMMWALVMAIVLTIWGRVGHGSWTALLTWWHVGVALTSALVAYYVVPWQEKILRERLRLT